MFGEPKPLFPRTEKDAVERMQNLEEKNIGTAVDSVSANSRASDTAPTTSSTPQAPHSALGVSPVPASPDSAVAPSSATASPSVVSVQGQLAGTVPHSQAVHAQLGAQLTEHTAAPVDSLTPV